jgi:predicted alpha/beta-hydrolase family hydrolase
MSYQRLWHHLLSIMDVEIELSHGTTTARVYKSNLQDEAAGAAACLILAHGAGAGQRHPFMVQFAQALSRRAIDVLTFDFLYMQQRRRIPDRMPQLVECWEMAIAAARTHLPSARERLFIGGKSMGGRAATHVVAASNESGGHRSDIHGVVLLGYPLHPPGRPDQLRDAHLPDVKLPMLFVQGTRDVFGTPAELAPILGRLSPAPTLHAVQGGDHSFKISGKDSATRQPAVYADIQDRIAQWMATVP